MRKPTFPFPLPRGREFCKVAAASNCFKLKKEEMKPCLYFLETAIFAHKKDYLRTRIFQRITQAQPQVCYSKQLVLGVEIVVEDFNFESQVLLMRTNLDNSYRK